jgi:heme/copper-type cytochrome/quinol oxidase subunit 3
MEQLEYPRILDVSGLPTVAFGSREVTWWGQLGLMASEGTLFGLLWVSYLYLRSRSTIWPPDAAPPELLWGTLNTFLLLVTFLPNKLLKSVSERGDLSKTLALLVVVIIMGIGNVTLRLLEFEHLNCFGNQNAYGSIVWTLLAFHTFHLVTDLLETIVMFAVLAAAPEGKRFNDVSVDVIYWYYIIAMWIPTYLIIYWAPRWL